MPRSNHKTLAIQNTNIVHVVFPHTTNSIVMIPIKNNLDETLKKSNSKNIFKFAQRVESNHKHLSELKKT